MVSELRGLVARAKELAHKRRQALTTAHVVVALFQGDRHAAQRLARVGLTEVSLLGALEHSYDERTNALDLALERAARIAAESSSACVTGEHLLCALAREPRCAAYACLMRLGVRADTLFEGAQLAVATRAVPASVSASAPAPREVYVALERSSQPSSVSQPMRSRVRRERGLRSAVLAQETETKLLRRGQLPSSDANVVNTANAETSEPASSSDAKEELSRAPRLRVRGPRAHAHAISAHTATSAQHVTTGKAPASHAPSAFMLDKERFPLLSAIGRNLTQLAADRAIDPVVGRDVEIEQLLDVLSRRRGNNPVLVGPPGVGKTAVVEGLAHALSAAHASGERRKLLIEVPVSGLLAGTGVRGALSERVQNLKREVAASKGEVLLFIDEIHTMLSGGEGADSLSNELKTALARGELPVIGATTWSEYRRVFERDAALARRFTRIEIGEPSAKDCVKILEGLAPYYEAHHDVRYDPSALEAAVAMSVRYLAEQKLPDKAIGLLDQAAARARRRAVSQVDAAQVAAVVAELAQVPVERLLMKDGEALLALDAQLASRVVGQRDAIASIAHALRKSAAGFHGQRPLGTFLFLGPTGVGKTEMAKAIATHVFPGAPMTRIDMSELGESHAVARLLGAPPGYVGHDEGGQLTEAVRHRPYQLILLDEIEKAHVEVLLSLLPLLDEGRLTDSRGRTVDFTNTVIVMTSNLGADSALARARIGFGESESRDRGQATSAAQKALAAARAALPPELWNRIDEPLFFHPLGADEIAEVAKRMLKEVASVLLDKHGVALVVEDSAIDALVQAGGFDRALGARPMRRTISRLVEAPLSHSILAGALRGKREVVLRGDGATVRLCPSTTEVYAAE